MCVMSGREGEGNNSSKGGYILHNAVRSLCMMSPTEPNEATKSVEVYTYCM